MENHINSLFGQNLECTRRLGFGGLYAEMIYNSKLQNDAAGFCRIEYQELNGLGQTTELLHFQTGKSYRWKVCAGQKVIVRFLAEHNRHFSVFEGSEGVFTSHLNHPHARFEVFSDKPITYISLKPTDAWHECRMDVLEMFKQLKPTTLRVPGGCYAERYCWKDGLLPIEERPIVPSWGKDSIFSANEHYDTHELNIDDYAAICDYLGAEMQYTVRLTGNTPQDAADLVEYCNGDSTTEYGALRAARGHKEPYNIKTWYIGNEMAFCSDVKQAVALSDSFTEAMLKVDPTIRTVVSTGNDEAWDDAFLAEAKHIDMTSQHFYLLDYLPHDRNFENALCGANDILYPRLQRAAKRAKNRKILFDEWNLQWGGFGDSNTAIFAASVYTLLIRCYDELNLAGSSYFAPINEGAIRVYPDHVMLSPDGEVIKRMAGHQNGTLIEQTDPNCVETVHEGYRYLSVCNLSADKDKILRNVNGVYELLTPNGTLMNITSGIGPLYSIPPASVAFIKIPTA